VQRIKPHPSQGSNNSKRVEMALFSLETFSYLALFVFLNLSPHCDTTSQDGGYTLYDQQGRPITNLSRIVEFERVQRNSSGNSNRFTVRFVPTVANLVHPNCIYHNGACLSNISVSQESSDRWKMSFEIPHTIKKAITGFGVLNREMEITLNNNGSDDVSQTHGLGHNLPKMNLNPVSEIVYNPGEDVDVTVNFGPHRPNSFKEGDLVPSVMFPFLYDLSEDRVIQDPMAYVQQSPLHGSGSPGSDYAYNYTLDTSDKLLCGCLVFMAEFTLTGSLVKRIGFYSVLPLRPSNQSRPFKAGFIKIWDADNFADDDEDEGNTECKYGEYCIVECNAVGRNISRMEIRQELLNGGENVVQSSDCKYQRHVCGLDWRFEAERDKADASGNLTFKCTAFDDSETTQAMQHISFKITE
ncbi:hypothetical protein PoB_005817100, partial [Plakobranchus ocellatus]